MQKKKKKKKKPPPEKTRLVNKSRHLKYLDLYSQLHFCNLESKVSVKALYCAPVIPWRMRLWMRLYMQSKKGTLILIKWTKELWQRMCIRERDSFSERDGVGVSRFKFHHWLFSVIRWWSAQCKLIAKCKRIVHYAKYETECTSYIKMHYTNFSCKRSSW